MIELPLVFLGGLLGSAHCVGMCGGFALSIGLGARGFAANLGRQLIYYRRPDFHLFVLRSRRRLHGLLARGASEPVDQCPGDALPGRGRVAGWSRAAGSGTRAAAVLAWIIRWRSCLPGGDVRRAVPHLTAAVECTCWREC